MFKALCVMLMLTTGFICHVQGDKYTVDGSGCVKVDI